MKTRGSITVELHTAQRPGNYVSCFHFDTNENVNRSGGNMCEVPLCMADVKLYEENVSSRRRWWLVKNMYKIYLREI